MYLNVWSPVGETVWGRVRKCGLAGVGMVWCVCGGADFEIFKSMPGPVSLSLLATCGLD